MATNEITITIKAEDDASDVLDRLKKKIGGVGDEGQKAGGKLGKKSGGLGGSIASLAGGLPPQAAAVAAFAAGIVKLGTGFVNAAAEVERLKAQMVQVEGGAKEADARMAELVQTSKDIIGLDLNSLVAFNTQLKAVSLNSGEVDTVVQSTVKAMAEMGKTSAQTSGVLTQVQQAFAANALKSEDLKTVFREMPQFLNAAKTAFGDTVTNVESFREAAEAAGMTARQALIETFKELDQVTEGASLDTYAAQTELLSENWQQFSAKVGSAVLPALTGIMNVVNQSFDYIEPVVKLIAKFAVEAVKLKVKTIPIVNIVKAWAAGFNFLKDIFLSIKFPTPIVEGFEKLKSVVQPALTPIIEGFQKLKDYFANFKFPSADEFSKWVDSINPAQMVKDIGLFIEGMLLKVKEFLNGLPIIGKAINDASLEAQKAAHAAAVAAETARKDKVAKDKKAAEDAVAAAAAEEKAKADIAEKYRVQARDARTAYLSDFKKLASDDYEGQRAMATKHFGAMQKMWENSTMDAKAQDAAIKTSKQNLQNTLDNINKAETASRVAAMKNQLSEMKSANEAMKHDDKTTREEMKTATTAYYELRRNIANLSIKDENKLKDELVKIKDAEDKEVRAIDSRYDKQDEARHRAELARSKEAREKRAGEMVAMASEIKLQITKMEGDETVSLENRKLANNRYYAFLKGAAAARITDQDALKTKLNEIEGQRINAERELEKGWQTEQDTARKAEEEKEVAAAQAEIDRRNAVRDAEIQALTDVETELIAVLQGKQTLQDAEKNIDIQRAIDVKTGRITELQAETTALKEELKTRGEDMTQEEKDAIQAAINAKEGRITELQGETTALQTEIGLRGEDLSQEEKDAIQNAIDAKTDRVAELKAETLALQEEITTRGEDLSQEEKDAIQNAIDTKTKRVEELEAETTALQTEITARDTEWSNEKKDAIQKAIDTKTDRVAELTAETNALKTELTTRGGELTEEKKAAIQAAIDAKTDRIVELKGETTALKTEITARDTEWSNEKKDAIQKAIDTKTDRVAELTAETNALKTELTTRGGELTEEKKAAIQASIDTKTERVNELKAETTALQTELTTREGDMNTWKTDDIQRAKDVKTDRILELQAETQELKTELGTRGTEMTEAERANIQAAIDTKTKRVGELQEETRALDTELTNRETAESVSVDTRIETANRLFDTKAEKMRLEIEDSDELEAALVQNEEDREAAVQTIRNDERQKNSDRIAAEKQELEDFNRARVTDAENALEDILADEKSSGRERRDAVNALYDAKEKAIRDSVDDEKEQARQLKKLDKERERHLKDTMTAMERAQRDYFQSVKDMAAEAFKFQVDLMVETHKAEREAGRDRMKYQAQFQTDWDTIVGNYEARITAIREQAAPIIAAETDKTKRNALIAKRDEVIQGVIDERTDDLQEITDRLNENEFDFYARMREIRHDATQNRNKALWEIGGQAAGGLLGLGVSALTGGAIPPNVAAQFGGDLGKFVGGKIGDWKAESAEDEFLKQEIQRWQRWEANRVANENRNIRTTADLDEALVGTDFDPAVIAQKQLDAQEAIQDRLEALRRERIDDLNWEVENHEYGLETMLKDETTTVEALEAEHKKLWGFKRELRLLEAKDFEDLQRITTRAARDRIAERDKMLEDFAERHKKDEEDTTETATTPTEPAKTPAEETGSKPPDKRKTRKDLLEDLQWEVDQAKHFLNQKLADEDAQLEEVLGLHQDYWDARLALAKGREEEESKHGRIETRHGWDFDADLARLKGQARWKPPAEKTEEEPAGESPADRAARIGDLRWEVEEAKHRLDAAKNDASKTKEELLDLLYEYWDARKALAEGMLDAKEQATDLERELTRIGWQRTAAETQLLNRFVEATTEETQPADKQKKRKKVLDDLQWAVDEARHFLNQKLADEDAQLQDVLQLHQDYWDARLALAKEREEDVSKHERLETRHGWDFDADLARLKGQARWKPPTEKTEEEPAGESPADRAARIGDLRWEVEEAKHRLDAAKNDASKTKEELLSLLYEYWDARKALAEGTLDAKEQATDLERELTRIGWQQTAAETQLLNRFVEATTEETQPADKQKKRKKVLDDLQWAVDQAKHFLNQKLADENAQLQDVLQLHQDYWDARLALAKEREEDTSKHERLETRHGWDFDTDLARLKAQSRWKPPAEETQPADKQKKRTALLDDLQWEVDKAKHFLDQKFADENAQLQDVLQLHQAYWDARLALAKEREEDVSKHERLTTQHGWDFEASLSRVKADFQRRIGKEKADQAKEAADDMSTERKKRIADLRWNVKDTKYWLDKAKADETATRDELLTVFKKYWDARLALARGTITDETELGREETEIGRARADARTELLERFVSDTEKATQSVSETIKDTTEEVVTHTRDAVTETTEALTEGLQSHTDMQATAISEQNETWNDFYTKQTSATTSFWSDFNAAAVAASEQLDTSLGTMETHWTDFFTNVKTAADALGIHFTNSLGAGVTLTGGATTAMQGSFQTLFAGAREDVTAFWQYHNLNLGFASLIVDNVLGNMKTDWTDYYADLKTETTGFWLSHNQSYGFGSLVVDSVLTSMKEMWQGFYDELRSMADSAGTHVSGVLGDMDSQIADTARSLARLQDEQRSATRTRVARRRVSRRELFHSDVNDRIAAAGGAQVASAVANRASVAAVQRQNAEDFTHFFGEGFMRKLQEAGITPDGAQRRGGAEQTTTVVSPIILQLDDGTLKKITERTLILEEEGTIQRGGAR